MADMIKKLPGYYRRSKVVADLYAVIQAYFDKTAADISETDISLFITTTNDFTKHESDVGLNNAGDTPENRRSQVIARLQGNNLLSRPELETLISNYEKSGCSIDEDFPNYTVYITFSGRKGIPENIELIKAAVNEVKPAHLRFEYAYCENTWQEVFEKFGAWGNIAENVTWEMLMYHNKAFIYLDDNNIPYDSSNTNAEVYFNNGKAYARRI